MHNLNVQLEIQTRCTAFKTETFCIICCWIASTGFDWNAGLRRTDCMDAISVALDIPRVWSNEEDMINYMIFSKIYMSYKVTCRAFRWTILCVEVTPVLGIRIPFGSDFFLLCDLLLFLFVDVGFCAILETLDENVCSSSASISIPFKQLPRDFAKFFLLEAWRCLAGFVSLDFNFDVRACLRNGALFICCRVTPMNVTYHH